MNKHFLYLRKDTIGELWFLFDTVRKYVKTLLCSLICRLYRFLGVKIGKKMKCHGLMKIYRQQCSQIIIGDYCSFISSSEFNYRGINHKCILQTGDPDAIIRIGNHCGFSGVSIVANKEVIIGNNVRMGANSSIADRDGHGAAIRPVKVDDNVWIGANVVIMKGVHIGENSIIGMNSVVTKDIPANSVAAGVPCKVIKGI